MSCSLACKRIAGEIIVMPGQMSPARAQCQPHGDRWTVAADLQSSHERVEITGSRCRFVSGPA
jgi:hypothetical protein